MIFSRYAPAIAVIAAVIAPTVLFAADPPAVRTRFHEYTEKWKTPKNPANPLCISYLGGAGNEWASGGGFQSDGSVIVVGTAAGPVFDLAGCPNIKVIGGSDGTAPILTDEQVLKTTVDKKSGKSSTAILVNSFHTAGAPFAAKLDADGKKIQTAIRLPWGVGSCSTGIVDAQGNVYLAGIGGPNLKALSPKALTPTIKAYTTKTGEAAPHQAFLLCLAPDLSSVKWCVSVPDYAFAPELRFNKKGELQLLGGHLNNFSTQGELIKHTDLHITAKWNRGVNPVDCTYALGWDTNPGTGREPWRQPHLEIHETDGAIRYEYYAWNGRLVGAPSSREVSDSSIKYLNYSDDGATLMMSCWSDGGNSVLLKSPYDIRHNVTKEFPGLGMSAWGINASSVCYIIKMNPETGKITGHTTYLSYLQTANKPNGLRVEHINVASDGSTIVCGGSASGFIQTGKSLFKGEYLGGSFVTIMNSDLSDLRFAGVIPGSGAVKLNLQDYEYASAKAVAGNHHRVLVVSGATKSTDFWTHNPVQPAFGGGQLDAAVVVLDLGLATK